MFIMKIIKFVVSPIEYCIKTVKRIFQWAGSTNRNEHLRYLTSFTIISTSIYINKQIPELTVQYYDLLTDSENKNLEETFKFLFLFSMSASSIVILRKFSEYILRPIFRRASRQLSLDLFEKANLSSQDLFLNYTDGEIAEKLTRASSSMSNFPSLLSFGLPTMVDTVITAYTLFHTSDNALIVDLVGFTIFYIVIVNKFMAKIRQLETSEILASSKVNNIFNEALLNYDSINNLLDNNTSLNRIDLIFKGFETASNQREGKNSILHIAENISVTINILLFRIYAFNSVANRAYDKNRYLFLDSLLIQITSCLEPISFYYKTTRESFRDINNYCDILYNMKVHQNISSHTQLNISNGKISFDKVTFSIKNKKIINNLTLEIFPGQFTAIVGSNGSGKSTLVKLLLKTFIPESGSIFIDNINIMDITLNSCKRGIAIAPQKPIIFNDTLAFNITCGRNINKEHLLEIIKLCGLTELISDYSDVSQVILGNYGIKLSGGQQQLISLARILVKNSKIIIYDEAFSQVDNKTFNHIAPVINAFNKNRTVIWISHELDQIKHADKISVLKNGKIIEQGTHRQLLEKKSVYSKLWGMKNLRENWRSMPIQENIAYQLKKFGIFPSVQEIENSTKGIDSNSFQI